MVISFASSAPSESTLTVASPPAAAFPVLPPCVIWEGGKAADTTMVRALAASLNVPVELRPAGNWEGAGCVVATHATPEDLARLAKLPVPTLASLAGGEVPVAGTDRRIHFPQGPGGFWPFAGSTFTAPLPGSPETSVAANLGAIVAFADQQAIWWSTEGGGARHDVIRFSLPVLVAGENLCDACKGSDFLRALPLLHLFRQLRLNAGWQPPPLRAAFMFDDANLHWPTYGYVNYPALLARARECHFHVAFATVPLDSWYVNRRTAELFRGAPERLSLLVHGNDHTPRELALPRPAADRRHLLATALRRIESLERRAGLRVARVMAAPHGACSEEMLQDLAATGFAGACISPWSLRDYNPDKPWVKRLGTEINEVIGECPVLPRFRLAAHCLPQILIAALLDQPIVPVGHHHTLAGGLGLLETLAAEINRLGKVNWLDLESMAALSYWSRRDGARLGVRPLARRMHIVIPDGITTLTIDSPAFAESSGWCRPKSGEHAPTTCGPVQEFPVRPGEVVHLQRICTADASTDTPMPRGGIRPWLAAHRVLGEVRDRLQPLAVWRKRRLAAGGS